MHQMDGEIACGALEGYLHGEGMRGERILSAG